MTNYFGFRLQKDYNKGNTIFGGMITATNRNIQNEGLNFLHDAAYTGGFDFIHRWKDKTYYLSLKTVFSHVRGSKVAILRTQESSVRYFQRPFQFRLHMHLTGTNSSILQPWIWMQEISIFLPESTKKRWVCHAA